MAFPIQRTKWLSILAVLYASKWIAYAVERAPAPVALSSREESEQIQLLGSKLNEMLSTRKNRANERLVNNPQDPDALAELADVNLRVGDLGRAIWQATKALESDRTNLAALRVRARAQFAARRLDATLADIEKALAIAPHDPELVELKAEVLLDMKQHDEAGRLLAGELETPQAKPRLHWLQARLHFEQQNLVAALQDLETATTLDPWQPDPYLLRSQIYRTQNRAADALQQIDLAIAADPLRSDAFLRRGLHNLHSGRQTAAFLDFLKAAVSGGSLRDRAQAHYQLGKISYDLGRHVDALKMFDQALRADPSNREAYRDRAKLYRELALVDHADRDEAILSVMQQLDSIAEQAGVRDIHTPLSADSGVFAELRNNTDFLKQQTGVEQLPAFEFSTSNSLSVGTIFLLIAAGSPQEVPLLAALGCSVPTECRSSGGETPLQIALARSPNLLLARHLIAFGANPDSHTPDGRTGWDLLQNRMQQDKELETIPLPQERTVQTFLATLDECLKVLIEKDLLMAKLAMGFYRRTSAPGARVNTSPQSVSPFSEAALDAMYGPQSDPSKTRLAEGRAAAGAALGTGDSARTDASRQQVALDKSISRTEESRATTTVDDSKKWSNYADQILRAAQRKAEVLYGLGSQEFANINNRCQQILTGEEQ